MAQDGFRPCYGEGAGGSGAEWLAGDDDESYGYEGAECTGMRSVTTLLAERGKSLEPPCPPGQRRFDVWLIGY